MKIRKGDFAGRDLSIKLCPRFSHISFFLFWSVFYWQNLQGIEQLCCFRIEGLLAFEAVPPFVTGKRQHEADGGRHYPLIGFRSYYPRNLLVFLLPNSWVGSKKRKRCRITIFVIVQSCNSTLMRLHYSFKPSGLIDGKPLYLDLSPLKVFVSLTTQVR